MQESLERSLESSWQEVTYLTPAFPPSLCGDLLPAATPVLQTLTTKHVWEAWMVLICGCACACVVVHVCVCEHLCV